MSVLQELGPELVSPAIVPSGSPAPRLAAGWFVLALIEPACIVAAAIGSAGVGRWAPMGPATYNDDAAGLGIAAAILFSAAAFIGGLYTEPAAGTSRGAGRVLLIWTVAFACLTGVAVALHITARPGPAVLMLFFAATSACLILVRQATRSGFLAASVPWSNVVVVTESGRPLSGSLSRTISASGRRIGMEIPVPASPDDAQFQRTTGTLIDLVRGQHVQEILLAIDCRKIELIEAVAARLRVVPVPVRLIPDETLGHLLRRPQAPLGVTHAIELQRAPLSQPQRAAKRALDLAVGAVALLFLLPVLMAIAVLIRLDSPGPILFRQRRSGFNGQLFCIYKFRTMTTLDDGTVIQQAHRGDARITRLGAILRRYSLDELPQLFNVLKGEMSLVGPRPHALAHDQEYSQAIAIYPARHNVKPGMTGWAQVNGLRGATPQLGQMVRRVEHDLWYVDHWSLWLDLKILTLTALGAGSAGNAY
ncbi:MAG TPA: exopolysaccharide biosynthesis polyprenyl glycosylphosphotransferase [Rhodopila sp.]|nr:exopolysaccharide biosynthesis polyprenyl glycosylphosphotransferase [Rhodopila sp.]